MNGIDSSSTPEGPLRVVVDDAGTRFVLSGTIGVTEAVDLHRAALAAVARPGNVVVDWSAADGIDTAVVGWTPLGHLELQRKRVRRPL